MSETNENYESNEIDVSQSEPSHNPTRLYMIIAAVLVAVIVAVGGYLVFKVLPSLVGKSPETAVVAVTPSLAPTFTPAPTKQPTNTPLPPATPTAPAFVMTDDYTVSYSLVSSGGRPSSEWTGFFGWVQGAEGQPLADIPLIILYPGGEPVELVDIPTSPIVKTGADGTYEFRLADAPLADVWTILVLDSDGKPASEPMSFETTLDVESGVQQIQVIWQQIAK